MTRAPRSTDNSDAPRRSRKAANPVARNPSRTFKPMAALGILWIVSTPRSPEKT
jgi:hypothetical protein